MKLLQRWRIFTLGSAFFAALAAAASVCAQDYPAKPVVIVVPFAPGGPTDTLARNLGVAMGAAIKQPIIIDSSGGAGGTIGINKVAKARADGYTILLMHIGMSTAPALYRKLPYDTINDFEPIGQVADVPMALIAKKHCRRTTSRSSSPTPRPTRTSSLTATPGSALRRTCAGCCS